MLLPLSQASGCLLSILITTDWDEELINFEENRFCLSDKCGCKFLSTACTGSLILGCGILRSSPMTGEKQSLIIADPVHFHEIADP